jgi:hypothetical protein
LIHSEDRNWLAAGLSGAAAIRLQAGDVGCALFPQSGAAPNEALLATVRLTLYRLVAGVETQLIDASAAEHLPASWEPLCTAGLLRDNGLIDFCLARHAERQIRLRLGEVVWGFEQQLAATLLHDADPILSEAAANVLRGENLELHESPEALTSQLPIDLAHALAWKVVAGLQFTDSPVSATRGELVKSCQKFLAGHNEGATLQNAAAKLVFFLPETRLPDLIDPCRSGLAIFVASLSRTTGLPQDRLYRLLDHDHPAAAMLALRASGLSAEAAIHALQALRHGRFGDDRYAVSYDELAAIAQADASAALSQFMSGGSDI